jgi:pyruvate kinase
MARRTKIVATLGPATDNERALDDLMQSGADLVRVNFSHGGFDEHARRIAAARAAAARAGRVVGILGDLRGPKVRIERFASGRAMLVDGETFTLDPAFDPKAGTDRIVGVAYESLPRDVRCGDTLLLNDGLISLEVTGIEGTRVQTRVLTGGELSDLKGLNKLGGGLSAGALTAKDREDVRMAAELGVDYLAVSFVRDREDIVEAWDLLRTAGGEGRVVAKIERREAIDNLEEIIDTSAAVMVARGDLGIEVGYAELTGLQKHIIERARAGIVCRVTARKFQRNDAAGLAIPCNPDFRHSAGAGTADERIAVSKPRTFDQYPHMLLR